jgi:hypothetical protein
MFDCGLVVLAIGSLALVYRIAVFVWIAYIKEIILCTICTAPITDFDNDLYHHTGILHGEVNKHVHLCSSCQKAINPPCCNFDLAVLAVKDKSGT